MDDTPTVGTVTPDDFRRIREVFELALQRPPQERRAFVEHACRGNSLLILEVERMLDAEVAHHELLDRGQRDRAAAPGPAGAAICSSCRTRLDHASRFCPSCGTPVGGAVTEEG